MPSHDLVALNITVPYSALTSHQCSTSHHTMPSQGPSQGPVTRCYALPSQSSTAPGHTMPLCRIAWLRLTVLCLYATRLYCALASRYSTKLCRHVTLPGYTTPSRHLVLLCPCRAKHSHRVHRPNAARLSSASAIPRFTSHCHDYARPSYARLCPCRASLHPAHTILRSTIYRPGSTWLCSYRTRCSLLCYDPTIRYHAKTPLHDIVLCTTLASPYVTQLRPDVALPYHAITLLGGARLCHSTT